VLFVSMGALLAGWPGAVVALLVLIVMFGGGWRYRRSDRKRAHAQADAQRLEAQRLEAYAQRLYETLSPEGKARADALSPKKIERPRWIIFPIWWHR
jgi:hypothetical protein